MLMNDTLVFARRSGLRRAGRLARNRIILVGARRDARKLLHHLEGSSGEELTIVGFVDAGHRHLSGPRARGRGRHLPVHPQAGPLPVLGGLDRLVEVVDRTGATDVVVALPPRPRRHLIPGLAKFTNSSVTVHWVHVEPGRGGRASARPSNQRPGPHQEPPERISGPSASWAVAAFDLARAAKRASDVAVSGLALLLLSPVFLIVAAAILATSGRPIFYTQERIGQGGRRFRIIKFRSMKTDAEQQTGPIWASNHDARCTRIGDWLRHTNIDETPQLFNVLKGDMSLVGPRPERPIFVDQFRRDIPEYDLRHAVPCGMTGWAQVHGWRGRTSLRKRIQYDLDYIQRWSFWLDFVIILMTVQHVAWGKTSWKISRAAKEGES
ncbi:UDP-glucose:undecaprenyl-phosphate glucose-1-phosphate transferase [Aquisphaera giovannonii]|uniref:UDP-glucose:undecaprenyl-phosphate glucose-1-phosphate transferase n=1 Tax=Aquisphaera giovannonii TaxID=406548 RepID=A0A5B9WC66_9BACT|nr:sugar transferase [Aquisphaera giovannonii]QEH37864.1 UDP-glucose:undecaprenyl-phosphate glucose-1-phosphate transferase [Aquisphaera giovannonii]